MTLYLLDTSALRGLGADILREHTFYTSPWCFWELLSHIDEESFIRRKGQLLKVRFTHILDDPRAAIEGSLTIQDTQLQKRVSDEELITYALDALHDSDSLERFHKAIIIDSNGELHQIENIAVRTREELEEREQRYIGFIRKIVNALQSGKVKVSNDEECHKTILRLLEGDVIKLKQRGAADKNLRERLVNGYYIHWSYVIQRALAYFQQGETKQMGNDYEDGEICKHLTLDSSYCLVTGDKRQKEALEKTITLINRRNDPDFQTHVRVVSYESLR